jgi:hypothetical protein
MYDFTKYPIKKKTYSGANGNKISILIDNELYMLKMPQHANKNENLSYSNSAISEKDPTNSNGANNVCLNEARINYKKYGRCETPLDLRCSKNLKKTN